MGAEYKVHTKLLTEFETLGVMGENNSGIIMGAITLHTSHFAAISGAFNGHCMRIRGLRPMGIDTGASCPMETSLRPLGIYAGVSCCP